MTHGEQLPGDGSGDGWTICAQGHRHWGLFGAAGLLIADDEQVILQHRAPWTHQGGVWGIPGGARDSHETAVQAALREASEEAGLLPADIQPFGLYFDDHGGWSYTTVVARPLTSLCPIALNAESVSVEWVPTSKIADLQLHSGFAGAWPQLASLPPTLHLVLDTELTDLELVMEFRRTGIAVDRLPPDVDGGRLSRLIPVIHQVSGPAETKTVLASLPRRQIVVALDLAAVQALGQAR